jgi:hypothetical protein
VPSALPRTACATSLSRDRSTARTGTSSGATRWPLGAPAHRRAGGRAGQQRAGGSSGWLSGATCLRAEPGGQGPARSQAGSRPLPVAGGAGRQGQAGVLAGSAGQLGSRAPHTHGSPCQSAPGHRRPASPRPAPAQRAPGCSLLPGRLSSSFITAISSSSYAYSSMRWSTLRALRCRRRGGVWAIAAGRGQQAPACGRVLR